MENGVLTYLNEAAYGEMKDLVRDVGINHDSIHFYNLKAIRRFKEQHVHESDGQFHYLMNAMFTPLDMTDHEDEFVGWNELPSELPINRQSWLRPLQAEPHPQVDKLAAIEQMEKREIYGTNEGLVGVLQARAADVEEEDDNEYGAEGDDDDEEEAGEEEAAEYGEEDYGDEGESWPPKD